MRLRLAWIVWLAVSLVAAQALGFAHRALHGPGEAHLGLQRLAPAAESPSHAAGHAAAPSHDASSAPGHAGHSLFSHVAGDTDCRLLDALGQPGAPGTPLLVLPLALSHFVLACGHGNFVARWVALFDARGPPARS